MYHDVARQWHGRDIRCDGGPATSASDAAEGLAIDRRETYSLPTRSIREYEKSGELSRRRGQWRWPVTREMAGLPSGAELSVPQVLSDAAGYL